MQETGAQRWPLVFTRKERSLLKKFLIEKCSNIDGYEYRTGRNAYPFNLIELPREIRKKIFTQELEFFLTSYFRSKPMIYTSEIIVVEAMSPQQEFHRDHGSGPNVAVCLAFTADGSKLGTLFIPGSHLDNQDTDDTVLQDKKKFDSASWTNDGLLYDIFTLHAGCKNNSKIDKNLRIFITFFPSILQEEKGIELRRDILSTFPEAKWEDFV
jgi:hypothetical protein